MTESAATNAEPDRSGRRPFGAPSAALLARADHGYARFLARATENATNSESGATPAPKSSQGRASR
ncbi:hypothetical protein OG379_39790 (plasmid) [Streptomyces sp. NBC_01166]|uniref:hypothetical protein n=1 Tax=Streptomyces sp. NBC_01166 TaxID=2903755 RepID=UPI002F91A417|nr:hypothetical protein OG379_39790 [Streptomyces sp. NBC_01166]